MRLAAAILLAAAMAAPALAQPAARLAVTHHVGHFNGQTVPYTATVAETFLHDGNRWPEIAALNKLKPPYAIPPGTKLKLPRS